MIEKDNFDEYLNLNEYARALVLCLIENLTILVQSNDYNDYFFLVKEKILNILLKLLTTSNKEIDDAKDNQSEFVSLAWDLYDGQKSGTVKSEAAKWLKAFADNLTGFCWTLISQILSYFNETFAASANTETLTNHVKPEELKEDTFVQFFSQNWPETIIDACFVSLAIVSHWFVTREATLYKLDTIIVNNADTIFKNSNFLIQARVILFMGALLKNI